MKFSYNEQREYETIEDDISKLEEKLEKLDDEMNKNATNSVKLKELIDSKEETETLLMEKMNRWEYLEDLAKISISLDLSTSFLINFVPSIQLFFVLKSILYLHLIF